MYYALVDCDNFYASCERVFNPKLKNRPVAILSNNDGCVVARSEEVKALGVKMGTPFFQVKELFKKNNVYTFSSNYELYGDMSQRVMSILSTYTSDVDYYSIDEAFLSLTLKPSQLSIIAENIVKKVLRWTGVPVKVGIARTKSLAKLGSHIVKKNKIPSRYFILSNKKDIETYLINIKVGDIWGVGRATSSKLQSLGITTAFELYSADENEMQRKFSINLKRTILELRGTRCIEFEDPEEITKSICSSKSFSKYVETYKGMSEAVATYISTASQKLRSKKLLAGSIIVFAHTNPHNLKLKQYSASTVVKLSTQTDNSKILLDHAIKGLKSIYKEGYKYNKAGVILVDLKSAGIVQPDLFQTLDKTDKLSAVIDSIKGKYGKGAIRFATEGIEKSWDMKRERLSKHYTTKWDEILEIKI